MQWYKYRGKHAINRRINGQLPIKITENVDHAYINEGSGTNYGPWMLVKKPKKGNKLKVVKGLNNACEVGCVPNRFEVL